MIRTLTAAVALALMSTAASAKGAAAQDVAPVAAQVATVTDTKGPVQVNQGDAFMNLHEGQTLNAGDRVMALRDGSALLTFADGCTLRVEPQTMVVVPATSTCAGATVATTSVPSTTSGGSGAVGDYDGGVDWAGFWTVAGVAIIGNAILFSQDDNEDDDNTVSP